jgi:preprotein translocase subunit SecE
VARDRKRARDRRARASREEIDGLPPQDQNLDDQPGPLGHSAPDTELAAAQLAVGRPELEGDELLDDDGPGGSAPDELQEEIHVAGRQTRRQRRLAQLQQAEAEAPETDEEPGAPVPAERPAEGGNRVIAFLGASWRELQRVQWPDRQQVAQATGVVLVFVVIAGLYLGLTGALASRLVKALLS